MASTEPAAAGADLASNNALIEEAQQALRESQMARTLLEAVLNADAIAEPEADVSSAERPGENAAESAASAPGEALPAEPAPASPPVKEEAPKVRLHCRKSALGLGKNVPDRPARGRTLAADTSIARAPQVAENGAASTQQPAPAAPPPAAPAAPAPVAPPPVVHAPPPPAPAPQPAAPAPAPAPASMIPAPGTAAPALPRRVEEDDKGRAGLKLVEGPALEATKVEIDAVLMAMRTRSTLSSVQDRGCATLAAMTDGNYTAQVLAVREQTSLAPIHSPPRLSSSVSRALDEPLRRTADTSAASRPAPIRIRPA